MQAAIDRVIRSFTFRHSVSLSEPMSEGPSVQTSDEATEFATRLLENYKGSWPGAA